MRGVLVASGMIRETSDAAICALFFAKRDMYVWPVCICEVQDVLNKASHVKIRCA